MRKIGNEDAVNTQRYFDDSADTRSEVNRLHRLGDVIVFVVCAVTVAPVNEFAPVFTAGASQTLTIVEENGDLTVVGNAVATDQDAPGDPLSMTVVMVPDSRSLSKSLRSTITRRSLRHQASPGFRRARRLWLRWRQPMPICRIRWSPTRSPAWYNLAGVMGWTEAPFGNDWVPVTAVDTSSAGVTLPHSGKVLPAGKILLRAGPQNVGMVALEERNYACDALAKDHLAGRMRLAA
jgi:hypothetical protein